MALRYTTQLFKVVSSTPTLSLLHFVNADTSQRTPSTQALVRNFANLRPPMAYTIIKDKSQVEHNYITLIRP